jgi:hypothetical protein
MAALWVAPTTEKQETKARRLFQIPSLDNDTAAVPILVQLDVFASNPMQYCDSHDSFTVPEVLDCLTPFGHT